MKQGSKWWMVVFFSCFPFFAYGTLMNSSEGWTAVDSPLQRGWRPYMFNRLSDYLSTLDTEALLVIEQGKIVYQYGPIERPLPVGEMGSGLLNVLYGASSNKHPQLSTNTALRVSTYADMMLRKDNYLPEARLSAYWDSTIGIRQNAQEWHFDTDAYKFLAQYYEFATEESPDLGFYFHVAVPLGMQDLNFYTDTVYVPSPKVTETRIEFQLSARDLARIGLLYLRKGIWGERVVVDKDWVIESFKPRAYEIKDWFDEASGNFGLGWWLTSQDGVHYPGVTFPTGVVSLRDTQGQFMVLIPSLDWVIVHRIDSQKGGVVSDKECAALLMNILLAKNFGF